MRHGGIGAAKLAVVAQAELVDVEPRKVIDERCASALWYVKMIEERALFACDVALLQSSSQRLPAESSAP